MFPKGKRFIIWHYTDIKQNWVILMTSSKRGWAHCLYNSKLQALRNIPVIYSVVCYKVDSAIRQTIRISLTIMASQHTSLASKFFSGCKAIYQLLACHRRWCGWKRCWGRWRIAQIVLLQESKELYVSHEAQPENSPCSTTRYCNPLPYVYSHDKQ